MKGVRQFIMILFRYSLNMFGDYKYKMAIQ